MDCNEIFSSKGKNMLNYFVIKNGRIVKTEFDKKSKSYVIKIDGNNSTRLKLPKKKKSLNIFHRFIIIQTFPLGGYLHFEIILKDPSKQRRRFIFSSNFSKVHITPFHIKIPINLIVGKWFNIIFDIGSMYHSCFNSFSFGIVEEIIIGPKCKIRKIFSMKKNPLDEVVIPKSVNFKSGVIYENLVHNIEIENEKLMNIKQIKQQENSYLDNSLLSDNLNYSVFRRQIKSSSSVLEAKYEKKPHIAFGRRFKSNVQKSKNQKNTPKNNGSPTQIKRPYTMNTFIKTPSSRKKKINLSRKSYIRRKRKKIQQKSSIKNQFKRYNKKNQKVYSPDKYDGYQETNILRLDSKPISPRINIIEPTENDSNISGKSNIEDVSVKFNIPPYKFRKNSKNNRKMTYENDLLCISKEKKYNPNNYVTPNKTKKKSKIEKNSVDILFDAIEKLDNEDGNLVEQSIDEEIPDFLRKSILKSQQEKKMQNQQQVIILPSNIGKKEEESEDSESDNDMFLINPQKREEEEEEYVKVESSNEEQEKGIKSKIIVSQILKSKENFLPPQKSNSPPFGDSIEESSDDEEEGSSSSSDDDEEFNVVIDGEGKKKSKNVTDDLPNPFLENDESQSPLQFNKKKKEKIPKFVDSIDNNNIEDDEEDMVQINDSFSENEEEDEEEKEISKIITKNNDNDNKNEEEIVLNMENMKPIKANESIKNSLSNSQGKLLKKINNGDKEIYLEYDPILELYYDKESNKYYSMK